MKLFFETGNQAAAFMHMVPLGFLAALCLEFGWIRPSVRVVLDVAVLLIAGIALLFTVVFCAEDAVRFYHLLGIITGALIWLNGMGKIIRWLLRRQDLRRRTPKKYYATGKDDAACAEP